MNWANAAALFVLFVGHCQLQVMLINFAHSIRVRCRLLRWVRRLHDTAIFVFPVMLVWFVGLRGPRLLLDGSWHDVPVRWWIVFGACLFGAAVLAFSSIRWLASRAPQALISNHSAIVDVVERLGKPPISEVWTSPVINWPGNQVFQLEVNEKRIAHPRLPAAWHGLSILHLSDTHFYGPIDVPFFREVAAIANEQQADLVAFTGDLLDRQSLTSWLPETLATIRAPLGCYFVLGNHDWYLEPEETRQAMIDAGWNNLAGRTLTVMGDHLPDAGPPLILGGDERPWMGDEPRFDSEQPGFRLLLSHTPDNLRSAEVQGVDLMLSGHNHGGQIVFPVLGPIYSPSRYGPKYSGGLYQAGSVLLHVSRGISGRLPLRWNCRPELTKLVLESGDPAS